MGHGVEPPSTHDTCSEGINDAPITSLDINRGQKNSFKEGCAKKSIGGEINFSQCL